MVDPLLLEHIMLDIQSYVNELREARDITWDVYSKDIRSKRFVERTLHIITEAMIDAVHHIISDEGLREPDTYRDAFRVLAEAGILSWDNLDTYEKIASFRNLLVHYYEKIDDEIVFSIFKKGLSDIEMFLHEIGSWLKKAGQSP